MMPQTQCSLIGVCWILFLLPEVLGASYLHSLPVYDGCAWVDSELGVFVMEEEPVVLHCADLERLVLHAALTPDNGYTFHITRGNGHTFHSAHDNHRGGRIRRDGRSLWLLPSQPSDSGTYTCVVRNESFCLKSNMSLAVYPSGRADMEMMSYLLAPVMPGNDGIIPCPIDDFNRTGSPLWYKDRSRAVLPVGRGRYHSQLGEILIIKHFSASDSGFYTCRVTVSVFSTLYNISRVSRMHTTGEAAPTFPPATISASTHTPETEDGYPRIIFPTNNSVFESHFGSSLVLRCTVVTGNRLTASTQVTWLVDGQSPSDLTPRVFQRELRLTGGQLEAELVILEVREEESWAEFRCVTQNSAGSQEVYVQLQMADEGSVWLAAGLFCGGCFVCVLSVFLYHLWPRPSLKHRDYFLTRQDSVF
ncbi:interleukin-1 receptor type 2-like [Alosa pseudoharengus]|uniref:interleukin-1 receptor type 2-like n=1 Tax=Alosa pseudoharengus TaxID=34774 RepID=UPI003F895E9D